MKILDFLFTYTVSLKIQHVFMKHGEVRYYALQCNEVTFFKVKTV